VTSVDGITADFYPFDMSLFAPRRDPHHQRGQLGSLTVKTSVQRN
jgi:hypothetical protein